MKILPANSEGCWLFIFVIFWSFFVIWFCIFLSFLFCGLIFFVIFLSFVKSFFVIFLSFFCRFLVVFYFLALFIFLSFSHKDQASGEGGKPGLGNAKKCKKWLPVWEMQKKCKKNDSQSGKCKKNAKKMTPSLGNAKMQKNAKKCEQNATKCKENAKKMTRVLVKLRFWSFQVGPASRAWAAPPGHFTPAPPPHPVFEPALHPEPGDKSSSRQAQKRIPQGKLPCPILLHCRLAFQEFLHLFLVFGAATR